MARVEILAWASCIAVVLVAGATKGTIGAIWGTTMVSSPMDPALVARMLKASGINKVKLFDADEYTLSALPVTGTEVMVAIPSDQLAPVGNEHFLTFPALRNIQKPLNKAGLDDRIKATVPFNGDAYGSPSDNLIPSAGNFRSDIRGLTTRMVRCLNANKSPFVVNIYPFISLYQNPNFSVEYAFFDGGANPVNDGETKHTYVFDANHGTLVWSLKKAQVPNMKIVVGELSWPTDGDIKATRDNARRFYDGLLRKLEG